MCLIRMCFYSAQHFQVILPQKECRGCSIKLLREAREWGQYQFWSCADVDILQNPQNSVNKQCSGHGQLQDGKCNCSPGYHGEYCQNKSKSLAFLLKRIKKLVEILQTTAKMTQIVALTVAA